MELFKLILNVNGKYRGIECTSMLYVIDEIKLMEHIKAFAYSKSQITVEILVYHIPNEKEYSVEVFIDKKSRVINRMSAYDITTDAVIELFDKAYNNLY